MFNVRSKTRSTNDVVEKRPDFQAKSVKEALEKVAQQTDDKFLGDMGIIISRKPIKADPYLS